MRYIAIVSLAVLCWGVASATTITSRVSNGADDVSRTATTMNPGSGSISFGVSSSWHAAFRFTNITIPPGSTINNAYITMIGSGSGSDPVNWRIYGEDTAGASVPSAYTDTTDWNARVRTTAYSDSNNVVQFVNDASYNTGNLSTIVQEIVDRPDWASGQAMAFFLLSNASSSGAYRSVIAFNFDPSRAALLTIDYTASGGPGPTTTDLFIKGGITLRGGVTVR